MIAKTGGIMLMIGQFLLTVIVSAVLYATGEKAADGLCRFARRLGGQHCESWQPRPFAASASAWWSPPRSSLPLPGLGLVAAGVPVAALLTAVTYTLLQAWVMRKEADEEELQPDSLT